MVDDAMKNQNNNDNNREYDVDELTSEQIAEINSIVVLDDPREFMPHVIGMSRENALAVLELTHRGKLSPSYQIYGFLMMLSLTGDMKQVIKMFKDGIDFLNKNGYYNNNDKN